MAVYYSKDKVVEIVSKYGENDHDTGNIEVQIALHTYRIEQLSAHLRTNAKDHACRRALLSLVGSRKGLLSYYSKKDIAKYRILIEKLGIRK